MSIGEILSNTNFWLIVLFTGAVVWMIRQATPDKLENAKWFKTVLRLAPALVGAGLACIPAIEIVKGTPQSIMVGFIGGTFSQTAYGFLRQIAPEKIKALMGSRVDRKTLNGEQE